MKKILSLLLAITLVTTLFTACSQKKETNANGSQGLKITKDFHYSDTDESTLRAYEKLCNAVINGEAEVKFNTAMTEKVNQLFYTCFPLYTLVDSIHFLEDKSGVTVVYKNSADEHKNKVSAFTAGVNEIMSACKYGQVSNDTYFVNLYSYITKNVSVDNSGSSAFDVIINKKGVPAAISSAFEYLLLQGGIDASHIVNMETGGMAKVLSSAQFKGNWYYFDPAGEIEKNKGAALVCFAMDDERAEIADTKGNFLYTDQSEADVYTDKTYDVLKKSQSYAVDGSKLTVKIKNNDDFVLNL